MPENAAIDLAYLTRRSACFNCWSRKEKLSATLWLMVKALKAIDPDHDFTDVNEFQRIIACFKCEPSEVLDSFLVAVFKELAQNFDAIGDLSPSEIRQQASCWFCMDETALKAGFIFLLNEIISDTSGGPDDD